MAGSEECGGSCRGCLEGARQKEISSLANIMEHGGEAGGRETVAARLDGARRSTRSHGTNSRETVRHGVGVGVRFAL